MGLNVHEIVGDLQAEHDALDLVIAPLSDSDWQRATPSTGWNVADQIAHLTYFDRAAVQAISHPEQFREDRDALHRQARGEPSAFDNLTLGAVRGMAPAELLVSWRSGRASLIDASWKLSAETRVDWYGPSMSVRSFLTARQMETWAHGQDIVDTVGARREPKDRLRNIAQLGVLTRQWSYSIHQLPVPEGVDIFVELRAPSGALWTWGDPESADSVSGNAEDFCLVVTQRRHVDDTALLVSGDLAREWLCIAQAFAGRPSHGPGAGSFSTGRREVI